MPLDQVGQRYAATLYNQKSAELQRQHVERLHNIRLDHIKRGVERSGFFFSAIAREGAQFVEELANALVDSRLEAYRQSHLVVDDQAVTDISRDADALCDSQGRNVANHVIEQIAQAGLPSATSAAIAAQANSAMSGAKARIYRKLSLLRDEQILASRSTPHAHAISEPIREPILRVTNERRPNILIRGWHGSKKWPWFGGLLTGAFLMLAVQEYALSIPLLLLAAVSLASKLWHSDETRVRKRLGAAGIAAACAFLLYTVVAVKGQSPWSHLQPALRRFIDKSSAQRPPQRPSPPPENQTPKAGASLYISRATEQVRKRLAPANERAPHQVRTPIQIAPQGIAITGGTVIDPTVNNFAPPEANITATVVDQPQTHNAKVPSIFVEVSVDHPMESAKFGIVCDRPCRAVGFKQASTGFLIVSCGTVDHRPNIAAFSIDAPNPFPPNSPVILIAQSADENPVRMVRVEKLSPPKQEDNR